MSRSRAGAVALAALLALAVPATARAHADLVSSDPAQGASLETAPASVSFAYDEPIEVSFGVIRVYDSAGREVQSGAPYRPPGTRDALAIALRPDLPDGAYRAVYRIIAVDAHPTVGGIVFSVGAGGAAAPPLPDEEAGSRAVSVASWADRWLGYAAIGLAVGALCFLLWAWRPALAVEAGAGDDWLEASAAFNRRLGLLLGIAVVTGIATSLLALPLQAASAGGIPFREALGGDALDAVLDTRFGPLMLVRAAAWALLGVVLAVAASRDRMPALKPARAGASGTALNRPPSLELIAVVMLPLGSLLVSPALVGHARSQTPQELLLPAGVVHLTAMSVWVGGLVLLATAVPAAAARLAAPDRGRLLLGTLSRFSTVALVSVLALASSGLAQAAVEVGSLGALVETGYGRAVLAKVLLLAALVVLGAANRERLLPALRQAVAAGRGPGSPWPWLRRNVRAELALIAVALAVAAALVAMAPVSGSDVPAAAPVVPERVSDRVVLGATTLRYTVDPARVGLNTLNLYLLDRRGRPYRRAAAVRAAIALGDEGAPRPVPLERIGAGHYVNSALELPEAGDWSLTVRVRVPGAAGRTVRLTIPIA